MFSHISDRFQDIFKKLSGRGRLTESNIAEALREVRLTLLEADVNYKVVSDFIEKVRVKAIGEEVLRSITPAQQVIKVVHSQMVALMGDEDSQLNLRRTPAVIMLIGLQGSGKTLTCVKLGSLLKKKGGNPLLVGTDVFRPAASLQLETLAKRVGLPVFGLKEGSQPIEITRAALSAAGRAGHTVVLIDTAGRLHIDRELTAELSEMKKISSPDEVLLVADAMTGQDAVNSAAAFNKIIGIDGIILAKLDGDARAGAALSIRAATGKPIKFIGVGEGTDELEPFHPERMAGRILGMGDVLGLVEKAGAMAEEKELENVQKAMGRGRLTLDDFLKQLKLVKKLGPLENILEMLPNFRGMKGAFDKKDIAHVEAIIMSMTPKERQDYQIINGSRRRRIAEGSGTSIQEVNRLLKQFVQVKGLLKDVGKMKKGIRGEMKWQL